MLTHMPISYSYLSQGLTLVIATIFHQSVSWFLHLSVHCKYDVLCVLFDAEITKKDSCLCVGDY